MNAAPIKSLNRSILSNGFHLPSRELCLGAMVLLSSLLALPGLGQIHADESLLYLTGKLMPAQGGGPMLQTPKKDFRLSARTSYLLHTLEDKRLASREVRLEGAPDPDGTFKVAKLFTIRNGKLYRVRYYCEVCNIEALEPGNCVCCQQPTELQEIPVSSTQ
jgi:hypothetical protein